MVDAVVTLSANGVSENRCRTPDTDPNPTTMTAENNVVPEEQETGLAIGTMDSDYDEGDDLNSKKKTEVTADPKATWRHNAGQIYKHTSSAIDELLSNSITAVLRARRMFDAWDAGVIARIIEKRENEVYLEIRDEGIGMTESFIETVLAKIGITTGAVGEDVNSNFGRGFFGSYMLVGDEKDDGSGAFLLSTNPRVTEDNPEDTPPHNLICQPGVFNWEDHEASLDPDEYGTRLKFPIRDGITADDLEEWIRDYAQSARLPIMFERYNPDGSVENDEIGGNNLEDTYPDEAPSIVIEENGLYRAVASPAASGKVVILDTRTTTNTSMAFSLYDWWNVDIRLLNEGGAIYDSPDEDKIGKTPISEDDYDNVPDNKKDEYILKSNVDQYKDKQLPQPSGTRDVIEIPHEFRNHVFDRLEQKTKRQVETALGQLDSPDDWDSLEDDHANILGSIINKRKRRWNFGSIADDDTISLLQTLSKSVHLIERGATINDRYNISSRKRTSERVHKVYQEYDRVFYGNSILQRRADAVWDASDDYAVVQVDTDMYDSLDDLGWEKITKIRSTTVDELDVSDEIVRQFKSARSTTTSAGSEYEGVASDYDDRSINLHYGNYPRTREVTVGNIRAHFGDDVDEYNDTLPEQVGRVVVFTSTSEHKISAHKSLVDPYTATATCVNKVYEENLSHLENVIKFEDYDTHNRDHSLLTATGTVPFEELLADDDPLNLIHLSSSWKDHIQELHNTVDWNLIGNLEPDAEGRTVLFTDDDVYATRAHLSDVSDSVLDEFTSFKANSVSEVYIQFSYHGSKNSWKRVVYARCPEWRDTDAIEPKAVIKNTSHTSRWEVVKRLGTLHDSDVPLSSATDDAVGETDTDDVLLTTSAGELSITDIQESDKELVVFPITEEVEPVFDAISPDLVKEYFVNHCSSPRYGSYVDIDDPDEYVLSIESYGRAQKLTRDYDVRVARPRSAPTVGNALSSQEPIPTYTSIYAYYKASDSTASYSHLKAYTDLTLIEDGYHTVNTVATAFDTDADNTEANTADD